MLTKFVVTSLMDQNTKGFFTHGTGHGVGIEVHELPNTNSGNKELLPKNAVVTVEPGIYIPNVGGVRIEDTTLVTEGEPINFTGLADKSMYQNQNKYKPPAGGFLIRV